MSVLAAFLRLYNAAVDAARTVGEADGAAEQTHDLRMTVMIKRHSDDPSVSSTKLLERPPAP